MRLRNISPLGQLDVPALYRQGEPFGQEGAGCLEPGEEFDCPDELGGRAPSETTDPETGVVTIDRGSGMLAQVGVFEEVKKPRRRGQESEGADG